jgi:HlyD family secretion protein
VAALNPHRWRLPALGLAVLALAAFFARDRLLGQPVTTVAAARGELVQTVVASGRVASPQRVAIAAEIGGRVAAIPVREGQAVARGEVLIRLDARDERAALEQARAAARQAQARLRQIRELGLPGAEQALIQAEANALQARRSFERSQDLRNRNFVGQAQLDEARRALDVAEAQLRAARLQVQSNRPGGSDAALAAAAAAQAEASLRAAEVRIDQTTVRAPVAGTLIGRSIEPGNVVQPGQTLMILAPAGQTELVLQIDEKNLGRLAPGQKALASADAYPRQRFDAVLSYINPGIDAQRGSVEVKLGVPQPPDYLRQDMTVSVDIEVARKAGALIAPADAVRDAASSAAWVLALRDGRAVRVPVRIGLRGDSRVEILEGLNEGEALIPATAVGITEGQRVRQAGGGAQAAGTPR